MIELWRTINLIISISSPIQSLGEAKVKYRSDTTNFICNPNKQVKDNKNKTASNYKHCSE